MPIGHFVSACHGEGDHNPQASTPWIPKSDYRQRHIHVAVVVKTHILLPNSALSRA